MPGAAEPVRSFELSQLSWGTGSTASSGGAVALQPELLTLPLVSAGAGWAVVI